MFRFSIVAALAALLAACHPNPPNPTLPQASGDVCLAPLPGGQSDPQPRDVHMMMDPPNQRVIVSMCVVSNSATPFSAISATVTVFTANGEFTSYGDGGVNYTAPIVSNTPGAPSIIASVGVAVAIDPKYVAMGLRKGVMIRLYSYPCGGNTADTCIKNPVPITETFMRDLAP